MYCGRTCVHLCCSISPPQRPHCRRRLSYWLARPPRSSRQSFEERPVSSAPLSSNAQVLSTCRTDCDNERTVSSRKKGDMPHKVRQTRRKTCLPFLARFSFFVQRGRTTTQQRADEMSTFRNTQALTTQNLGCIRAASTTAVSIGTAIVFNWAQNSL